MSSKRGAEASSLFKILGDETRLQIIGLLLESDLCVGALARYLNFSKPAVSQHLKLLREAGLIKGEKRGYWTHYKVEREPLKNAAHFLQEMAEATGREAYICLRQKGKETDSERRVLQMCKDCCQQPDQLKTKPEECTHEQIEKCHGSEKDHCCEKEE